MSRQISKVFLTHQQAEGGDQVAIIGNLLERVGIEVWSDQKAKEVTAQSMEDGVRNADLVIIFVTASLGKSYYAAWEICTALKYEKTIRCVIERDPNHYGSPSAASVVEDLYVLFNQHEALTIKGVDSIQDLSRRLGMIENAIPYTRAFENQAAELDFLKSIVGIEFIYPKRILQCLEALPVLYLACNPANGYDQCLILKGELLSRMNVSSKILTSDSDCITVANHSIPVVVFVTDDCFVAPHIHECMASATRIAFVVEGDMRKVGAGSCRDLFNGDESKWLRDEISRLPSKELRDKCFSATGAALTFRKNDRKSYLMAPFLEELLDSVGLAAPPSALPLVARVANTVLDPRSNDPITRFVNRWMNHNGIATDTAVASRGLLVMCSNSEQVTVEARLMSALSKRTAAHCRLGDYNGANAQKDIIKSISAQMFTNLPGFKDGFPRASDQEANKFISEASKLSLQAFANAIIVSPGFYAMGKMTSKRVVLVSGITSTMSELAAVLRNLCETLPATLGVVILATDEVPVDSDVLRSFLDFTELKVSDPANGDDTTSASSDSDGRQLDGDLSRPSIVLASPKLGTEALEWDVYVSFVGEEATDQARSLAMDFILTKMAVKVWIDPSRSLAEAKAGLENSRCAIFIITSGSGDDELQQSELSAVKAAGKPFMVLLESDPTKYGIARVHEREVDPSVELLYRRCGQPRAAMMQSLARILPVAPLDETKLFLQVKDKQSQVLILGDAKDNLDMLVQLGEAVSLTFGVSYRIIDDAQDDITEAFQSCSAVLCVVTHGMFAIDFVMSSLRDLVTSQKPFLYVYDCDKRGLKAPIYRSNGNLNFESLLAGVTKSEDIALINEVIARNEFLPYDAKSRLKGSEKRHFLNKALEKLGLVNDLKGSLIPPLFDPSAIPIEKAKEMEAGTRDWVFTNLEHWLDTTSSNNGLFLLLGGAGMGKSVILAEIARRGNAGLAHALGGSSISSLSSTTSVLVAGYHFFRSQDVIANSALIALLSLHVQLRSAIPALAIITSEDIDKKRKDNPTLKQWLWYLIVDPVSRLEEAAILSNTKLILLLDALDECLEVDELVRALREAWTSLGRPKWLLLVASARSQAGIVDDLKAFNPTILEPSSMDNRKDIDMYLRRRLLSWGTDPSLLNDMTLAIIDQSEGVFIWVRFQEPIIKSLMNDRRDKSRKVSIDEIRMLPKGLKQVYAKYFSDLLQALGGKQDVYRLVVGLAIVVPRADIPETLWRRSLGSSANKNKNDDEQRFHREIFLPASRLLLFQQIESGNGRGGSRSGAKVLKAPHKSMVDWLIGDASDSTTAKGMGRSDLAIDAYTQAHHLALARVLQEVVLEKSVSIEPFAAADALSFDMRYAIQNAAYHWSKAKESAKAITWFTNFQSLYWMVAVATDEYKSINKLDDDLEKIPDVSGNLPCKLVRSLLNLAYYALANDFRQLAGQVLGRFPNSQLRAGQSKADPETVFSEQFRAEAEAWVKTAVLRGGLQIYIPANPNTSSLQYVGGSLLKLMSFPSQPACGAFIPISSGSISKQRMFVAGFYDCCLRICNLDTGMVEKVLEIPRQEGHQPNSITTLAVDRHGKRLVSSAYGKNLAVWDLSSQSLKEVLPGEHSKINSIALSGNGEICVTGNDDHSVVVWQIENGLVVKVINSHTAKVTSVALTEDGSVCVSGSADKTIRLHKIVSLTRNGFIRQIPFIGGRTSGSSSTTTSILGKHDEEIRSVAIDAKGTVAVSASDQDLIKLWDLKRRFCKHNIKCHAVSVAVSADGLFCFAGTSSDCRVYDVKSGSLLKKLAGHTSSVWNGCFDHLNHNHVLSLSMDFTVRMWDISVSDIPKNLPHSREIICIEVAKNKSVCLTGSVDRTVAVWDCKTAQVLQKWESSSKDFPVSIALSRDGKRCITGSNSETIKVWDVQTGKLVREIEKSEGCSGLIISPDGTICACRGGFSSLGLVFDVETGERIGSIGTRNDYKIEGFGQAQVRELTLSSPDGQICCVRLAATNASTNVEAKSVLYFDTRTCEKLASIPDTIIFEPGPVNGNLKDFVVYRGGRYCDEGDVGVTFDSNVDDGNNKLFVYKDLAYGNCSDQLFLWKLQSGV